ncbi:phage tail protein [Mongoliitalea daihaiensis]|uniref:phage tail protein n=1 Tax=Mongoliitalea daihaiensis TaxID=2782006 RepID=UPI001F39E58B|nr:phage tail protein [Mongoliitalea daihaiensis]UJP65743.1 phage tail protein [Mongoliitalea daihaiensis]
MIEELPDNTWPVPKLVFLVDWGSLRNIPFQEVDGLEMVPQVLEYRHSFSPVFSTSSVPGSGGQHKPIFLKNGLVSKESIFWDWYRQIQSGTVYRQDLTISLADESGAVIILWTLRNASLAKLVFTDNAEVGQSGVAIDHMEVYHGGIETNKR